MGTRISQFTPLTTVASADYFPLVQDSDTTNKRVSLASLLASVPLGSAATPSIAFTGDLNTGIYSPGADQVAVATNGTGRLFVDASGNVGVGTSSVNALLEVNNSTAGGEVQRIEGNYSGSGSVILTNWRRAGGSVAAALKYNDDSSPLCMSIGTTTSHEFRIRTADTDAITIDASQRVGIGTSSVGDQTDIAAGNYRGLTIKCGTTAHRPTLSFLNTADSLAAYIQATGSNLAFGVMGTDYGGHTPRMTLTGTGLGIGTTSPASNLHVNASNATFDLQDSAATNSIGRLINASGILYIQSQNNTSHGQIVFRTSDGSATERLRIDSSGRLLVGTSSASSTATTLLLQGSPDGSTGASYLRLATGTASPGSTATIGQISFTDSGHSTAASIVAFRDGGTWTSGSSQPTILTFSTTADGGSSPVEHLRINSEGTHTIWASSAPMVWGRNLTDSSVVALAFYNTATSTTSLTGQVFRVMCDGDVENANNAYGAISDASLKENIVDARSQWDDIKALQVRNYNFKAETGLNTHTQIGLVAQETELVSPGLVGECIDEKTGDATKTVNYSVLYMKAVKALQEAMERIEQLEADVAQLKGA
jgi:hypothetical protein